jgi:hypothetical protein
MKNSNKLSDLLFNNPAKVKGLPKINLNKPIPIGHLLAVMCYDGEEHKETLFIDHIDVCKSHTVFVFNKDYHETLYFGVDYSITTLYNTRVFYDNDTSIDIIRIR